MKALDRIVLTAAGAAVVFVGGVALVVVAGWDGGPAAADLLAAATGPGRVEAGLFGLLAAAVGFYTLAVAWQRDRSGDDIRLEADGGDIRISLNAIESVVFEAAAETDGVDEVTARLDVRDGELLLDVAVHVASDRPMPDVARDVQQRVGERIRDIAGVPVARLDVQVRAVSKPRRPRVE